jgi:hypothetical protein
MLIQSLKPVIDSTGQVLVYRQIVTYNLCVITGVVDESMPAQAREKLVSNKITDF